MDQSLLAHHGRVAAVAVGVQRPGEPCEQAFGDIARAGRVILEQHDGRLGAGAHLRPELGLRFRCLAGLFEDLHRGLVHQQVGPFDEFVAQHVDERRHERSDAHHPSCKRGARELDADALELLALAIQRQRIGVLRRGDAGEQSGAGEALGDRLRQHRGGAKVPFATRATVLATDMTQHPHLHGNDVELLAHHLGEALELHPVMRAGAFIFGQPMLDVDAWQRLGYRCALRGPAPMGGDFGARRALGLFGRGGLSLVEQSQLPVGNLLRRRGKAPRKQQPHLLLQVLDHRITLCEPGLVLGDDGVALGEFGFVVAHLRVQRGDLFTGGGNNRRAHGR